MRTTPFAAFVPYSVAADGPFTISMSSISSGLSVLSSEKLTSVPDDERAGRVAHAVDVPDRRVAQADRRHAANAHRRRAAELGARQQRDARRLRDQQVGDVVVRRLLDALRHVAERRDRVAELDAALLAGGGGHDFLELRDGDGQREVGGRRARPRATLTVFFCDWKPTRSTCTCAVPAATFLSVNLPSSPVVADSVEPMTSTRASASGCPVPCAVTRPVIVPCAGVARAAGEQRRARRR